MRKVHRKSIGCPLSQHLRAGIRKHPNMVFNVYIPSKVILHRSSRLSSEWRLAKWSFASSSAPVVHRCAAHLSNIYRTSIELISNIYRASIEHLSNIYRTSIENLSKIYRASIEHLSKVYRTSIAHLSSTYRTSIEHISKTYRASSELLSNIHRTPIEHLSNTYGLYDSAFRGGIKPVYT